MKTVSAVTILCCLCLNTGCAGSVKTGLDNIDSYRHLFQGKRVGIIANHTARNSNGEFIVDVFRNTEEVTVTALFSPEHGLYGAEEAGRTIDSTVDPNTGLPVYSLYGKTRKPTREMLKDVDVLVFDIQDVGARFYTYIYTMSLAMEAAAESHKRFIVLDRPDLINGVTVEGNVLEPEYASFVGMYPIPVRFGMTMGELAKMFNGQGWLASGVNADLIVIPMKNWRRGMWYEQTKLKFVKPSPNIPDVDTAAIYPGLCLLEGTNVSEGRGTNMPFKQFGAPWINSNQLTENLNQLNLPGLKFDPTTFTPASSKCKDILCNGVKITVTDRSKLEPYWAGILIVNEIYRMYPDKFEWIESHFDRLCGTSVIRKAIIAGSSLDQAKNDWQSDLNAFVQIRNKYLIYSE
jgi:uncharacterized protein YbbC (DUF1343 family)